MPLESEPTPIHFMRQSERAPHHTAIIMDGNGRWATARGLDRSMGHCEGARALRRAVEAAPALGIRTLTLYAFSSDNWNRPAAEVNALMTLLACHLRSEAERCRVEGVRMTMIGRRDRLPASVLESAADAESATFDGTRLHLRIAVDYSARDAILRATQIAAHATRDTFSRAIGEDVDLLIRTGGEQRLSDFLLWESAYAELVFTTRLWPDFDGHDLRAAVAAFHARHRRFGRIPAQAPLGQSYIADGAGTVCQLRRDRWLR